MPELGPFGSARGVPGNGHPYRKPGSVAAGSHQRCTAKRYVWSSLESGHRVASSIE